MAFILLIRLLRDKYVEKHWVLTRANRSQCRDIAPFRHHWYVHTKP